MIRNKNTNLHPSKASLYLMLLMGLTLIVIPFTTEASQTEEGSKVAPAKFQVCMDFGCKRKQGVKMSNDDWASVSNWFLVPAESAEDERTLIKQAIGWMEVIVGRYTPTHRDVGGNLLKEGETPFPGQLDCIDESLNTTTYLRMFEEAGYLHHHEVIDRAYRRSIFDQHWAGQLKELASGERWVVDSWFQNNGNLPYVQLSSKWEDIPLITSYLDSSQKQDKPKKKSFWKRLTQ